jgi:hypothetical protein
MRRQAYKGMKGNSFRTAQIAREAIYPATPAPDEPGKASI